MPRNDTRQGLLLTPLNYLAALVGERLAIQGDIEQDIGIE